MSPPWNENQTVAVEEEMEANTAMSPQSLVSSQDRPNEAVQVEGDRQISSNRLIDKADGAFVVSEGGEVGISKIPQAQSENILQVAPRILSLDVGMPEAEHVGPHGSEGATEEVVESRELVEKAEETPGGDEQMISGPMEHQPTSYASQSPAVSEASIITLSESSSAEEGEAAPAILSPTPESLASTESFEDLSMRGASVEPARSDYSRSDLGTDEGFSESGSESPENSQEELDVSFLSDWTGSEVENRRILDSEIVQEPILESQEDHESLDEDEESPTEASYFGLDGSAISRNRLSPSPIPLANGPVETLDILAISEEEDDRGVEDIPLVHDQIRSAESGVVADAGVNGSESLEAETSPEAEVVVECQKLFVDNNHAKDEEAEAYNQEGVEVIPLGQLETFEVIKNAHDEDGTGGIEDETSYPDVAHGLVRDNVHDLPSALSPGGAEVNSEDLHDAAIVNLAITAEQNLSPSIAIRDRKEARNTSPIILARMSMVEIIDLESDDEEDNGSEDAEEEAEIHPTIQELDLNPTQTSDYQMFPVKDEKENMIVNVTVQPDNATQRKGSNLETIETTETRLQIGKAKGSPAPKSPDTQRGADHEHKAIDVITTASHVKDEALVDTDDELPDILDLFEASKNSMIENDKVIAKSHLSQEKTEHFRENELHSETRVSFKEEVNDEVKEDDKEDTSEMLPLTDSKLQTQLLTPNATQQTQLLSQESFLSLQLMHEDQEPPTPRLTQNVSGTSVAPTTPKRRSVVERLKEMRSRSAKSPRSRRSADVATPWFAPKKSNQTIPNTDSDSVDSQHSTSEVSSDNEESHPNKNLSVTPIPQSLRQSPRLHKTLPALESTQHSGFRTTHSYFASLSALSSHFNETTDVFATIVSSTTPVRAKTGPKDFYQSLCLTDPSSATSSLAATIARIFRPYKTALPLVTQGDAILLRNFKVQSHAMTTMLLSTDTSAWAVFRKGEEAQMRGPPVEFGAEERGFAKGLWSWWASLSSHKIEKLEAAVPKEKGKGNPSKEEKATPNPRKLTRAAVRHELRDGTTYVDGDSDEPSEGDEEEEGGSGKGSNKSTPRKTRAVRHELRDGTTYTDVGTAGKWGVHELRGGVRYKDHGL